MNIIRFIWRDFVGCVRVDFFIDRLLTREIVLRKQEFDLNMLAGEYWPKNFWTEEWNLCYIPI